MRFVRNWVQERDAEDRADMKTPKMLSWGYHGKISCKNKAFKRELPLPLHHLLLVLKQGPKALLAVEGWQLCIGVELLLPPFVDSSFVADFAVASFVVALV